MKRLKNILLLLSLVLGFISCQHKELFLCPEEGDIPIQVIIHWDSVPSSQLVLPGNMTVHWYPASGSIISKDMNVYGGRIQLFANVYDAMCMDFNGNSNIAFRSNGTQPDFEAYNVRMTGSYNINVPQLPGGEVTVAEANPTRFYIDSRSQNIDTRNLPFNDTLTVHFYPKNVLREFTFLIYDVIGAKNMIAGSGAISGMSGSYWPVTGDLAAKPSTLLFNRIQAIVDAQTSTRWTDEEKALFTAKNPDWASPDTLVGWTRDWVTGRFVTFGPLDREAHIFRLAVEGVNRANNSYYGSWGYWAGQAENSVAAQIDSAMGKSGAIEEQLAWRQRNGGYDIILYNDRRLVVPEEEAGGTTDGGFLIDVDDWGEIIMLPTGIETLGITSLRNAPINTAASINNFVLSGFWNDGVNHGTLFNAQNIYKTESGVWDYSPKKYWPESGEVDFYAYAPAGIPGLIKGLAGNGSSTTSPILEYELDYDRQQEDLLVAIASYPSPQTGVVKLNFRHAFSRLTGVEARMATKNDAIRYKIKSAELVMSAKGKLRLDKNAGPAWENLPASTGCPLKLKSPNVAIDNKNYTALLHPNDAVFLIPQPAENVSVHIIYDIYNWNDLEGETLAVGGSNKVKTVQLPTDFVFEAGKQYIIRIEL